jgi:large subunit ribosomal protein L10
MSKTTRLFYSVPVCRLNCKKSLERRTHIKMKEAQKQKQLIIDEIKDKFERAESAVVIDYIGITVAQADAMRKNLREAGVDYTVYKNTLVKRAIAGTKYEALGEVLEGPSGFAFSYDDATAPARVLANAIKDFKKMEFKGGVVEGEVYGKEDIQAIADIPSREILIARFLGSIQGPIRGLAVGLQAIIDKANGGEAAAE